MTDTTTSPTTVPATTPRQVKEAVRAIVTAPTPDFGPYLACDKSGRAAGGLKAK